MRKPLAYLALAGLLVMSGKVATAENSEPVELQWSQLVPPTQTKPAVGAKAFFSGAIPSTPDSPPPPPVAEGKWMARAHQQPGQGLPPAVVADLNGKRVHIGGYVVPLDFDATTVKEFLLVPFVGACIHVPPPPANQIIYVKTEKGFEIKTPFDPVYVTGTLKTDGQFTGLAETGYSLDADSVDLRKQ